MADSSPPAHAAVSERGGEAPYATGSQPRRIAGDRGGVVLSSCFGPDLCAGRVAPRIDWLQSSGRCPSVSNSASMLRLAMGVEVGAKTVSDREGGLCTVQADWPEADRPRNHNGRSDGRRATWGRASVARTGPLGTRRNRAVWRCARGFLRSTSAFRHRRHSDGRYWPLRGFFWSHALGRVHNYIRSCGSAVPHFRDRSISAVYPAADRSRRMR